MGKGMDLESCSMGIIESLKATKWTEAWFWDVERGRREIVILDNGNSEKLMDMDEAHVWINGDR
jgi:hypothetical protein